MQSALYHFYTEEYLDHQTFQTGTYILSSTEVKNLKIIRRKAPYIISMPLTCGTSLQSGVLKLSTPR